MAWGMAEWLNGTKRAYTLDHNLAFVVPLFEFLTPFWLMLTISGWYIGISTMMRIVPARHLPAPPVDPLAAMVGAARHRACR